MKTVSVIICNNGLGHCKRVLSVIRSLSARASDVRFHLFVDANKLRAFDNLLSGMDVQVTDYQADVVGAENALQGFKQEISQSDAVWSDNFVFPITYHKQAFLTGTFLWKDVVKDKAFCIREESLLAEQKPVMVASLLFATPEVQERTRMIPVGIYEYFPAGFEKNGKAVLISCGNSLEGKKYFESRLEQVKQAIKKIPRDISIFVEPAYVQVLAVRDRVLAADYSEEMFSRVMAAVIRPGIGTICDVLSKGGRIFAFGESNMELQHNAASLQAAGVGEDCASIVEAIEGALMFMEDENKVLKHFNAIKALSFNGIEKTAHAILNMLNNGVHHDCHSRSLSKS